MAKTKGNAPGDMTKKTAIKDNSKVKDNAKLRWYHPKRWARMFASWGRRSVKFIREVISELKKVTWPTRKDLTSYTLAVLVFVLIFGAITFIMDTGLSAAVNLLLK